MRYAKGHGTGNDFVIIPDPDGQLDLTSGLVRRLCDRHAGIGADGVLRVVRTGAAGAVAASLAAEWFMDYRNSDGSIAEMCGNGIRVFARYLIEAGLATGPELPVGTRAGVRLVRQEGPGEFAVDMGPAVTGEASWAVVGGRRLTGVAVNVGNPHLVCVVAEPVAAFDLTSAPETDPQVFPDGVNVEIVRLAGERAVEMRVFERGSGETLSCGTGAVAAATAAAAATGNWPGAGGEADRWTVDVPGGRLAVVPSPAHSLLAGPAVIVAHGEADAAWLAGTLVTA